MERNIETLVIGTNDNDTVVVMDINYYINKSGIKELACSFNIIEARKLSCSSIEDDVKEQIECMDNDTRLDLLDTFDCKPSELLQILIDRYDVYENGDIYTDFGLYQDNNDIQYFFNINACGQCDPRDLDNFKPINSNVYKLLEFWSKYHLKSTPQSVFDEITTILNKIPSKYKYENFEAYGKTSLEDYWSDGTSRGWLKY